MSTGLLFYLTKISITSTEMVLKVKHKRQNATTYIWLKRLYPGYRFEMEIYTLAFARVLQTESNLLPRKYNYAIY